MDDLRRDHPRLKAIIVEDALASNAPHITHLKNRGFSYILGAKPGDHKLLFSRFEASDSKKSWKTRDKKTGNVQHFEWDKGLPLNNANSDLKVNMLKYKETDKKGETTKSLCILFRPYQHFVGQGLLATTFCRSIVPAEQNA